MEEKAVEEDEDAETLICHALGDQQKDSTVGHTVHPATTAVADAEAKRKYTMTTQPQRISWVSPRTRLYDIIAIVK